MIDRLQTVTHQPTGSCVIEISTIIIICLHFSQNESRVFLSSENSLPFDRHYHDYLVLSSLYALYCCISYRQCSWRVKTCFIVICTLVQLCSLEFIWLTTNISLSSIDSLHHYTASALILLHNVLLILGAYVREWLEKIDFIWLREIDVERVKSLRQRHELIQQTSLLLPMRLIAYYLNNASDATLTQHYHVKYDRMALLSIHFRVFPHEQEYVLVDFLHHLDYVVKTNERYVNIVMHRKSTVNEILFSNDMDRSVDAIHQLVELLFLVDERLKQRFQSQIDLTACLHIGSVHEILVHLERSPRTDLWSEHITFMQLLMSHVQANHCLVTAAAYQRLNDVYLFRTAGSIHRTQMSIGNHTAIYYLLGRLIGENTFEVSRSDESKQRGERRTSSTVVQGAEAKSLRSKRLYQYSQIDTRRQKLAGELRDIA